MAIESNNQFSESTKTPKIRANYTRNFLAENEISDDDFIDMAGKIGVTVEANDIKNNESLVSKVVDIQKKLGFPEEDNQNGQDGMLGPYTLENLRTRIGSQAERKDLSGKVADSGEPAAADAPADVPSADKPPVAKAPEAAPAAKPLVAAPSTPKPPLKKPDVDVASAENLRPKEIPIELWKKYLDKQRELVRMLNPAKVSLIPYTPPTKEIPAKGNMLAIALAGDWDAKLSSRYKDTKDKISYEKNSKFPNLSEFQSHLKEWDIDLVVGLGDMKPDVMKDGKNQHDLGNYDGLMDDVVGGLKGFDKVTKKEGQAIAWAAIMGNHDVIEKGRKVSYRDLTPLFKRTLENYQESRVGGNVEAFSFQAQKDTNLTVICFNKGTRFISDEQIQFFEKICKEAATKGHSVMFANHIPPFQHSYGWGLAHEGKESGRSLTQFGRIQQIARTYIENRGSAFYIVNGDNHLSNVYGNAIDPGALAANYWYLDDGDATNGKGKSALRSVPSSAVLHIEKNTGFIKGVYFRTPRSDFKEPLPSDKHALAWGVNAKDQEALVAKK